MKTYSHVSSNYNGAKSFIWHIKHNNSIYFDRLDGYAKMIRYGQGYFLKDDYVDGKMITSTSLFKIQNELANDCFVGDII